MLNISDREFVWIQHFMFESAGISLPPSKKQMVCGRLARRLKYHGLASFEAYFRLISDQRHATEKQTAIDLLTTNETSFFREPDHFELLASLIRQARSRGKAVRVWSAACATGEEPYSIAMVLAECLGDADWEVMASDINTRVLQEAVRGIYPNARAQGLPRTLLHRYCLRGTGPREGMLSVVPELRQRVMFCQINLNAPLPDIGTFEIIFLRNAMIYFSQETKRGIVERVLTKLGPGGHLFIGHAETLNGQSPGIRLIAPASYRKV